MWNVWQHRVHSLRRQERKGISDEWISAALDAPTWIVPTTRNPRYDGLTADGRRYGVVFALEHYPVVVVPVFWHDEERGR